MNNNEIITLQFGNFSNYVGTHWWNLQEAQFSYDSVKSSEVSHDVLFREGQTAKRQTTFTPRMLLMDLKGSMTRFRTEGELYADAVEDHNAVELWDETKVEVIKAEAVKKPEYLMDLDDPAVETEDKEYNFVESVQEWSDFMYSRYHPRSVNILTEYGHEVAETAFDTFALGTEAWRTQEDFEDKIRNSIEECDSCQGFQVLLDVDDGFGGLAAKCCDTLQDDYGKALLCVPIFSPRNRQFKNCDTPMSDSIRMMNIALTYSHFSEVSSMFCPLSTMQRGWRHLGNARKLPGVDYVAENFYHSAAILATFLDTISLRYRLRNPAATSHLSGFCVDMTGYGRKMVAAGLALPFHMNDSEDFIECLDGVEGPMFETISPGTTVGTDYVIQSIAMRGVPENRLKKPREKAEKQMQMAAYKCTSVSEMLQLYYQCAYHSSMAHVTAIDAGLDLKKPFPKEIFADSLAEDGFVSMIPGQQLNSVPVMANVQNSSKLGDTLDNLYREVKRIKFAKIHRFRESNLEAEEYEESLERLLNFKENYDEGYQL